MEDSRRQGTRCPRCASTHMEMAVRRGSIVYVCLECAHEWPERRISTLASSEGGLPAAHSAVEAILRARDLQPLIVATRDWARRLTGADGIAFILRAGDSCQYVDEEAIGPLFKGQHFPLQHSVAGWSILNRRPVLIPDIYADPRVPHDAYRATFVKSLVVVPVRKLDPLGAIGAYWQTESAPSAADVQLLELLAEAAAVGLGRDQLRARVMEAARPA